MKFRHFIVLPLLVFAVCGWSAPKDIENSSKIGFLAHIDSLWVCGNQFYLESNRIGIKECADSIQSTMDLMQGLGLLLTTERDSLMQYVWKLQGSYHYENSDYDNSSYAMAEQFYLRALDYAHNHSNEQSSPHNQFILHRELAQLYYKEKRWKEALEMMDTAYTKEAGNYYDNENDTLYDIASQYAMCLARVGNFDDALMEMENVVENYEATDSEKYGEALRKKAKILILQQDATGKPATEALVLYKKYFELKRKDAMRRFAQMSSVEREQYWMRIRPFVTDCYRLENEDAAFLFDVTLFSKGLLLQLNRDGGGTQALNASWQQVQRYLPDDACAIEFIQYEKQGIQQMASLVLNKTGIPCFIPMPSPDSIYDYKKGAKTVRERLYSLVGKDKNEMYNDSTGLFRMIWNHALLQAVGQVRNVYFAPDGYIHQLAIEYMLPENVNFRPHRLTSTRRILEKRTSLDVNHALIVGGVDYTTSGSSEGGENDADAYRYVQGRRFHFKYLNNSKSEVDSIILSRHSVGDTLLVGDRATEQNFRFLASQYPIIHLSTHGVFGASSISQGTDLKPCLSDASLSESLLALAGLQSTLDSETFDPLRPDGVLSAKEISSLDLSHVELVVLACCETGLGYVTSEGVYGIQRGLKNAGAGAIIVTLWDIDDEATKMFMIALHHNLCQGQTISQAFANARSEFIISGIETGGVKFNQGTLTQAEVSANDKLEYAEPRYRDAFILIDAVE